MPRTSSRPTVLIAVTVSGACRALSLGPGELKRIRSAIELGDLECRQIGLRKLIPIGGPKGLEAWFATFPRPKLRG